MDFTEALQFPAQWHGDVRPDAAIASVRNSKKSQGTVCLPPLSRVMGSDLRADTFSDGTIAMAALVFGWFWPLIIVSITGYLDRKRTGDDHVV